MFFRLIILFLFLILNSAKAQNSELWLMDLNGWNDKLLIDWRSSPPNFELIDNVFPHSSGTPNITVSNKCGEVLFYTDLFCIMNHNLSDSLLADSITGNISSGVSETGGIVKMPGSDSIYLIIRTNFDQYRYFDGSFVPFDLDSTIGYALWSYNSMTQRGELISRQNKFYDFYSDQLTIIKHANERDYWLVGREIDGNILVWSIDSSGIEANPTIFTSSAIRSDISRKYPNSQMYCSPSGKNLFYVHHNLDQIYLCIGEFDRERGQFKEVRKIAIPVYDPFFNEIQEIRSFVYSEECRTLYFVENAYRNRLLKYRFDNKFNLLDSTTIYKSSDYSDVRKDEINLAQMKKFRNKIYFTNETYNGSIYTDSAKLKMSVLELPGDCSDKEVFKLMDFETGGYFYKSNNSTGKFPMAIGGNYNDEKTIVIENVCFGDTSILKSYNTGCNPFVEWDIKEKNESVGKIFTQENLSYQFQSPGLHKVEYRTTADTIVEFVNIELKLEGPLSIDTLICENESVLIGDLGIESSSANFIWNTGEKEMSIQIEEEGTFVQTAYNTCNSISNTWEVRVLPNAVNSISDTVINSCNENSVEISIPEGEWSLRWYDSNNQNTRNFEKTGIYNVNVFNQCFDTTFTFAVNFESDNVINQVNVFTPNGDGYNDLFKPYSEYINPEGFNLTIYNRWGRKVFDTNDPNVYWDGLNVPDGDYFYSLNFKLCNNSIKEIKGFVKLIK
ncbi:gliding motility-associated C-terminal domain-containing protein [Hyphobacterium sp. CCMP332]|nr:gliding motility-associated C-terminal domain-containing protein [Hyphobacterium sp. CCMP332]